MVLTPWFTLSQNESFVILVIRIPYVKISNAEFLVEGTRFSFYLKPYLLDLEFKQPLTGEEPEKATYNYETCIISSLGARFKLFLQMN